MKITTNDCLNAISDYLINQNKEFNAKDWKRISKKGTGDNIIRKFQNKKTDEEIYVKSSDSEIFEISDTDFDNKIITNFSNFTTNEFSDFPFVRKCDFATIYSKSEISDWEIDSDVDVDEYDKDKVSKGTRIGICDSNNDWEPELETIIVVEKDMKWYSYDGWTTDDMIYFEVNKKAYYAPASEPVDLLETGYKNGGGSNVGTKKILQKQVNQYKLDHLLYGN